jgi:hypothetical protein
MKDWLPPPGAVSEPKMGRMEGEKTRAEEWDCAGDRRDILREMRAGRRDWGMGTKRALLGGGSWRGHGLWELVELEGGVTGRRDARELD